MHMPRRNVKMSWFKLLMFCVAVVCFKTHLGEPSSIDNAPAVSLLECVIKPFHEGKSIGRRYTHHVIFKFSTTRMELVLHIAHVLGDGAERLHPTPQ
jgi:hypothetical protein